MGVWWLLQTITEHVMFGACCVGLRWLNYAIKCHGFGLFLFTHSLHVACLFLSLQTMTNFEPLHKLQAHNGYILKCLLSPEFCDPHRLATFPIWEHFYFSSDLYINISSMMGLELCFRYLATASSDHTVKIWNVEGFTLEKTLIGTFGTHSASSVFHMHLKLKSDKTNVMSQLPSWFLV